MYEHNESKPRVCIMTHMKSHIRTYAKKTHSLRYKLYNKLEFLPAFRIIPAMIPTTVQRYKL